MARAQVYELSGGNSSLYEAGGGTLAVHGPSYNASIGAGVIGGHFAYGAKMEKAVGKNVYSAGDEQIDFLLPTDVFDPSHYLFARGLGMKTKRDGFDIAAFAGTASKLYETPLFEGAGFGDGMGFLSLHKAISPKWKFASETIVASRMTEIASLEWEPIRKCLMAISGGTGANEPYAAASLNVSRKWFDVVGSYVYAGPDFKRVTVTSPMQAEPDKGNFLATFKPSSFLSISGGAQNYLVPIDNTNPVGNLASPTQSSSVRNAGVNLLAGKAMFNGSVYSSTVLGQTSHAAAFTAAREINRWLRVSSNYMVAKPKDAAASSGSLTTFTETLNQHIGVNESISASNGQTSFLYGGTLLTNFISISASYETFYVPLHPSNPFQQSLMLDVGIHLFGRVKLHGATFVGPTGHLLYTSTVNLVESREQGGGVEYQHPLLGNSILRALVVDALGQPVEGAALMVDSKPVFTNADGIFELTEKKAKAHTVEVLTDKFLYGGQWQVDSKPQAIWSSIRSDEPTARIVVRRIPLAASAAEAGNAAAGESGRR